MSVFGKILDTLGLGSVVAAIPAAKEAAKSVAAAATKPVAAPAPAAPKPVASVDVMAQMLAAFAGEPVWQWLPSAQADAVDTVGSVCMLTRITHRRP